MTKLCITTTTTQTGRRQHGSSDMDNIKLLGLLMHRCAQPLPPSWPPQPTRLSNHRCTQSLSEEASKEKDDSKGEASDIVFLKKATRRSRNCEHSCMRWALLVHGCARKRSGWWGTCRVCMCSGRQSVQQFRD